VRRNPSLLHSLSRSHLFLKREKKGGEKGEYRDSVSQEEGRKGVGYPISVLPLWARAREKKKKEEDSSTTGFWSPYISR